MEFTVSSGKEVYDALTPALVKEHSCILFRMVDTPSGLAATVMRSVVIGAVRKRAAALSITLFPMQFCHMVTPHGIEFVRGADAEDIRSNEHIVVWGERNRPCLTLASAVGVLSSLLDEEKVIIIRSYDNKTVVIYKKEGNYDADQAVQAGSAQQQGPE